jgi:hypothetical protein
MLWFHTTRYIKMVFSICPEMFSFWDALLSNGARYQMIKPWVPHGYSECSSPIARQLAVCCMVFWYTHTLTCCCWPLSEFSESCHKILNSPESDLIKWVPLGVPTKRSPLELDLANDKAVQLALQLQSPFLDVSHSSKPDIFPICAGTWLSWNCTLCHSYRHILKQPH